LNTTVAQPTTVIPPLAGPFTGTAGPDTILGTKFANVLSGYAGNDTLKGFGGKDVLLGGAGVDKLFGGQGNDILAGGLGRDYFVFDTKPNKFTNRDKITDFRVADDTIQLNNAVFKVGKDGWLKAAAFEKNLTGKAEDASDRIIYESDTGKLFYDPDGSGSAAGVHFATVGKKLAMTHKDFFIL
jgi:Ca2+-binding RTX toxin-like protein